MKQYVLLILFIFLIPALLPAQQLSPKWEELAASDWDEALMKSDSTCILPIGILEKHGPHLPIGSDIIAARSSALDAAQKEYAVVFPEYYFGQIYEARHQPGTFALPSDLVWDLLKATVAEIARNGFKKIIIVNGHGGNNYLLPYFVQSQLESRTDYVVYLFSPEQDQDFRQKVQALRKSDPSYDMHAGETESSVLLYLRPDLVKLERADMESGKDQARLNLPGSLYTAIWWYARFPNHYAGVGGAATRELGKLLYEHQVNELAEAIKAVKNDAITPAVQDEFFDRVDALGDK